MIRRSESGGRLRLRVRRQEVVDDDGIHASTWAVFCPVEGRSMHLDVCRRCTDLRQIDDHVVECEPALERLASALAQDPRLGGDACVGLAMGEHAVSVRAEASAEAVAKAFGHTSSAVVAVIDAERRLVGLVERDRTDRSAATSARHLARAVQPLREDTTLAVAVARMVAERTRVLPVVDDEAYFVGLLFDLDALRWIARGEPRG